MVKELFNDFVFVGNIWTHLVIQDVEGEKRVFHDGTQSKMFSETLGKRGQSNV